MLNQVNATNTITYVEKPGGITSILAFMTDTELQMIAWFSALHTFTLYTNYTKYHSLYCFKGYPWSTIICLPGILCGIYIYDIQFMVGFLSDCTTSWKILKTTTTFSWFLWSRHMQATRYLEMLKKEARDIHLYWWLYWHCLSLLIRQRSSVHTALHPGISDLWLRN